ncbi:MAG: hypothetical protein JWR67_3342, partial [Mucilaginibacter sp.]|nr:hypothetical protein [Mucilaginibacter sp.]
SGVTRDITEQKLAEESLVRSEGNLRSVFENTDLSIILFTNDLKVAAFNSNANGFVLRNFKKYIKVSDSGFDFFPEQRKDFIRQVMERIDQKEEEISYETSYIRDGITEWYDVKWIGIFNPQMENIGIVFTVKNITEKKNDDFEREKMTADLVRRNNDLEQFTYIISHNLRAPVANIIGLSDLMQKFDTGQEEDTKALKALSVSAKRLDEVILDLNHILQLNNEVNEKIETIDLPNIIENIKTSITNLIEKENVSFNLNFDEVSSITTLKNYLHSIFFNLIINSIKYRQSHLPPVIDISTVKDDNKIIVKYKDNGKGIDLEKNGKDLFGLYKRFDYSVEGKGMGLFMVKTQIENLGGKISVESQLGKGTEFKLEFPIQQ